MKDRPFKILGVQQVAIGSKDKSKLNNLWVGLLGISVNESHTSKDENVVEDICSFADDKLAVQIDLMEPLLSSEGSYFGLDIDVNGDTVAIAGYYRDIFNAGSYTDTTSVFTIHSTTSFDNSSWIISDPVIPNIVIDHSSVSPVDIEVGDEFTHLLYTHSEELPSGSVVDAIWYAHGDLGNENWLYRKDVVEDGDNPVLLVLSEEGIDRIYTAWTIGDGYSMQLTLTEADTSFNQLNETSLSTPGIRHISLLDKNGEVFIVMDAVGTNNQPLVGVGVFDDDIGIGIRLSPGRLLDAQYSSENEELVILIDVLGQVRLRALVFDQPVEPSSSNPFDRLRIILGVDSNTWRTISLLGGVACISANILLGLILQSCLHSSWRNSFHMVSFL